MQIRNGRMQSSFDRGEDNRVMPIELVSLNIGRAEPRTIAGRHVVTAIDKRPAAGEVALRPLGLEGDEQADPSVHGGLSKAVYAYPLEHYPVWQTLRAQAGVAGRDAELPPGAMGENLSLRGLLENQVWVGDLLRFPDAELVVSEPRFPCFKFNDAMGFAQAARMMVQSGYCGFYLAVRKPGRLAAGQRAELLPGPRELSVPELFRAKAARAV
jgi:MOSC domain-containing protein YiiM